MARLAVAVSIASCAILAGCGADDRLVSYVAADMVTGREVSIADLRGQPALLVSWATWCAECDEVLSGLQEFADSPAADGIAVVAVNLDAGDVTAQIEAKLAGNDLRTALWRDPRNEFKRAFAALGVPTSVLLDPDGRVAALFPGAVDFGDDTFIRAIDQVRAGPSP